MQLSQSLNLKQRQSLVMTPQLQQAIKLLQLTNIELQQYLEEQTAENPFLDVSEERKEGSEPENLTNENESKAKTENETIEFQDTTDFSDDPTKNEDYENRFDSSNLELSSPKNSSSNSAEDWDVIANTIPTRTKSLIQHIEDQLPLLLDTPREVFVAQYFLEALEPSGWLGKTIHEISLESGLTEEELGKTLQKLQGVEPTGIFARNLSECLKLQIQEKGLLCNHFKILFENLEMLGKGELTALTKKIGCDDKKLKELLCIIKGLDPKPGSSFSSEIQQITKPDLIVRNYNGTWLVDLNRSTLPTINVNEDYAKKLSQIDADKKVDNFANQALSSARWLKRALEQRNLTTLKITAEIVKKQKKFLEKGIDFLEPLSLKDIAEAVKMHESTVSRVTNGLLIATPKGSFPLKSLFSVTIETKDNNLGTSAAAVRNMIKNILKDETRDKPFSDELIAKLVSKKGVKLARRTVAKYREMLNIPSSSERKRRAKLELITSN